MTPNLRKECYLLITPLSASVIAVFWLAAGLYFLAAFQEYQHIAPQLAQLENRRGATQMLLLPVNQLVLWLMVIWSSVFGVRALAQEYEWQTAQLAAVSSRHLAWRKIRLQWPVILLISLPFWLAAGWAGTGTDWDSGLLAGIFASQLLISGYAVLLTACLALAFRQSLAAALAGILLWAALWLLPLLLTEPPAASVMLQWLSPFAHAGLLTQGQFSLQTGVFAGMHALFFLSWLFVLQRENC